MNGRPGINIGENGATTVVAKFYFTNQNHLPVGIDEKTRPDDAKMDERHATAQPELGEVGRVRENRVDTGVEVLENVPSVTPSDLVKALANAGFHLADAHYYYQKPRQGGKPGKFVVCLTFRRIDYTEIMPDKTAAALRQLATTTWQHLRGWENPGGVATLNFLGRDWDDRTKAYRAAHHRVTVHNHHICVEENA